jgi:hypothetical protein
VLQGIVSRYLILSQLLDRHSVSAFVFVLYRAAFRQSAKGLVTAGATRSAVYLVQKIGKAIAKRK